MLLFLSILEKWLQRGHVRPVVASDIEAEIVRVIREGRIHSVFQYIHSLLYAILLIYRFTFFFFSFYFVKKFFLICVRIYF